MAEYIQTKAFFLHRTPYNDKYQIAHFYTLKQGRVGVLLPSRAGRSSRKRGFPPLNHLSEVELVLVKKNNRELYFLDEIQLINPNHKLQVAPNKLVQVIYMSELLYQCLKLPVEDAELYHFLHQSLEILSSLEQGIGNFYLCFTWKLLDYLAVMPDLHQQEKKYFDLDEACFTDSLHLNHKYLSEEASKHLKLFSRIDWSNLHCFKYSRSNRTEILDRLMDYYLIHIPLFRPLKSISILRSSNR